MYRKITYWYGQLLSWLLVFSVAVLIVPVALQIFSRYTELIPSYIWTEEMARFFLVWTVMIGAMLGVRESRHFEVDIWPRLAPRADAALRLVTDLAVLVFALVFVWAGWEFTRFAWNRISELAELPLWLIHMAWPIAGVTWLLFVGEQAWDHVRTLITGVPTGKRDEQPHAEAV
ncbi:MAG TPA: TRAP transporter small permease [Burkholderiales bacterium]|jgi:TRAP-type C4-dicarboxylate transport system permease small subunit